jgi:hypothetical protein
MMPDSDELLYLNGLNAITGEPLIEPVALDDIAERIVREFKIRRPDLQITYDRSAFDETALDNPARAGWALMVHTDEADAMKERLARLIDHRRGRVIVYRGEPVRVWKEENNADESDFEKLPYYLLIAGAPDKIPFDLQFSLSALRAVGRVDFDDPADYERYAQTVIANETGKTRAPAKRAVFFAPRHPGDNPTQQSSRHLVQPIREQLPQSDIPHGMAFTDLTGKDATKANLIAALAADESGSTPSLLFSASHGAAVDAANSDQRVLQGSIVCQDRKFPLKPDPCRGFISGYDVAEGFQLPGGIHFFFACYGAGTLARSDFVHYLPSEEARQRIAASQGREDFVAHLPKALLANPRGGALAVVGHVDPAWIHAFRSPATRRRRIVSFGFALARLLRGKPVGFAIDGFRGKCADVASDLLDMIKARGKSDQAPPPDYYASMWICRNDAQKYVIIGDPAARLKFA